MRSRLPVEDGGDDANDDREAERDEAHFGLVEAAAAVGEEPDELVGTPAEEGEGDEGSDDLAAVGVADGRVGPVVGRGVEDVAVGEADGDVGAKRKAVEAESPEDLGVEQKLECLL